MNVEERLRLCSIIEKLEKQKECSKRLELENRSKFHGIPIRTERY